MTHEGQHHVSNLVSDLVEMAQATKRLPELERELAEVRAELAKRSERIAFLESRIEEEVATNTQLAGKLHAAEVARDDAGFRQLEAEDKANALHRAIESIFPALGQSLAAVNGDGKDQVRRVNREEQAAFEMWREEQAYKQAEAERKAAEEAARPIPASTIPEPPQSAPSASVDLSTTAASIDPFLAYGSAPSGERAADPTGASSEAGPSPSPEPSGSSTFSASGVSVSSDPTASQPTYPFSIAPDTTATPPDGAPTPASLKYANKAYRSWPVYVSEADWCRGGGTTESYWEGREQYRNVQAGVA